MSRRIQLAKKDKARAAAKLPQQLIAELRADGDDRIADLIAWWIERAEPAASDLPPLAKFVDWCRERQASRGDAVSWTSKELAALLGWSVQKLGIVVKHGLRREPSGVFPASSTLQFFGAEYDKLRLLDARFRKIKDTLDEQKQVKLQLEELKLARERGDLVDRESAEAAFVALGHTVRVEFEHLRDLAGRQPKGAESDVLTEWWEKHLARSLDRIRRKVKQAAGCDA